MRSHRGFKLTHYRKLGVAIVVLLAFVGCGSDDKKPAAAPTASSSGASSVSGSVTVFAAASLTGSFTNEQTTLKTEQPGLTVTYNFAGSGTLVTQLTEGAPADVIATADTASMQKLVDAGLVEAPTVFVHNRPQIMTAPGNPKGIHTVADLARSDVTVVLCDSTVPAGKYAAQILSGAGVTVEPKSLETDVKSAVARVTSGEADASIVYTTDVTAAGSKAAGVEIPDAQNVIVDYPIALVKASTNKAAAEAFIAAIVSGSGQDALERAGFITA